MHPALMGKKPDGMIIIAEKEEKGSSDPIMDMIDCMRKKDIQGCLMALAHHFATESNEDDMY
jgi:hypothetical protein